MSATRQTTPSKSSLPTQPSLEYLRKEAKRRLAKLRAGGAGVQLADAQLLLAREYGFSSWRALKAGVEIDGPPAPHHRPPLNQYRTATSHMTALDRMGVENAFFNFIALAMFLTCMGTTIDLGSRKLSHNAAPVRVYVEFTR